MKVYPEVDIRTVCIEGEYWITQISTTHRKLHTDGKWYLQYFFKESRDNNLNDCLKHCASDFHRDLYLAQTFGKILPNTKNHFGQNLFILDTNQRSEEERLKDLYQPYETTT